MGHISADQQILQSTANVILQQINAQLVAIRAHEINSVQNGDKERRADYAWLQNEELLHIFQDVVRRDFLENQRVSLEILDEPSEHGAHGLDRFLVRLGKALRENGQRALDLHKFGLDHVLATVGRYFERVSLRYNTVQQKSEKN